MGGYWQSFLDKKSKMLRSNGLLRTVALNTNPYDGSEFKKGNQGPLDDEHVHKFLIIPIKVTIITSYFFKFDQFNIILVKNGHSIFLIWHKKGQLYHFSA